METINTRSRAIIIFIVTALLALSYFQSGVNLGQDLKGGTILRFSLDIDGAIKSGRLDASTNREEFVANTISVIDKRINTFGLAETVLTQVGDNKFEISLPAGASGGVEGIVKVVTSLGDLAFRIQARPIPSSNPDAPRKQVGPAKFEEWKQIEYSRYRQLVDNGDEYRPISRKDNPNAEPFYLVKREGTEGTSINDFAVCEIPDDRHNFDGGILENPRVSRNETNNQPTVVFDVKESWQNVFGEWTGANVGQPMAIILNEEFTGTGDAPIIQSKLTSNVQITLGSLTFSEAKKRAKELATVLQTGSLKIRPVLESRNRIGATLAGESRSRGILAVMFAFGLVLLFMLLYYRGAGLVANFALLLNLLLLVGFLAFFQAVLTLPGIAGIVLTVGMAVDANILINERIREERRLGRSLRRALHEGYAKALSAIIDANVTSLITAAFLYTYGSGPIKGFAVTLAIGLLVSMFTAIYVTRTVFEWRASKGGMQNLGTYGNAEPPKFNWIGMRRIFAPISVILVVGGLLIFSATDKYTLYDVDFTGGYKLQVQFTEETSPDTVREALANGSPMNVEVKSRDYNASGKLVTMTHNLTVGPYPNAETLAVGSAGTLVEIKVQRLFEGVPEGVLEADQAKAFETYVRTLFQGKLVPTWVLDGPKAFTHTGVGDSNPLTDVSGGLHTRVALADPDGVLAVEDLSELLKTKFPYFTYAGNKRVRNEPAAVTDFTRNVHIVPGESPATGIKVFDVYTKATVGQRTVELSTDHMAENLAEYLGSKAFREALAERVGKDRAADTEGVGLSDPFPSQDQIGSTVAQRLKNDAMVALFLSLIGIIIYIAIRFNSRSMGFAAVLCLFHDVAITLGVTAIVNQMGIIDAKINLAMVAAFLTLVGYSVNDTVVVFDRIREERGKRRTISPGMINLAINLTLARTIRTSLTFLLVCVALFAFNLGQRNVLEGFSFLLIVGSIVGTYSTIAISSPLLLYLPWLWERIGNFAPKTSMLSNAAQNAATLILVPVLAVIWLAWWMVFAVGALIAGLVLFVPWALSDDAEGGVQITEPAA